MRLDVVCLNVDSNLKFSLSLCLFFRVGGIVLSIKTWHNRQGFSGSRLFCSPFWMMMMMMFPLLTNRLSCHQEKDS